MDRPPHDEVAEKLLPQNEDAETNTLGTILIGGIEALNDIVPILTPEDMNRHEYRIIYEVAVDLYKDGRPADLITLCDELERRGKLEEVGGVSFVSALSNNVPNYRNAKYYAEIVKRTADNRRFIKYAEQVAARAYHDQDPDLVLLMAEQGLTRIRQGMPATKEGAHFLDDDELDKVPPAHGMLGNILFEQSFAILYGPSGRWKSFIALAWALAIATGTPWLGRHVAEGDVFYVAAEGGLGIRNRVRAWKRRNGVTKTRMYTLLAPVNLLNTGGVQQLISQIRAKSETPAVVVLDTLSRCMPGGDENGGKDGSAAVAAVDAIRGALGCTVLVVAHPGKDEARGIRGWSGYFAAADTVIRVGGGGNDARIEPGTPITLHCDKPKEQEPFQDITLTAEIERWATDEGAIESSLVIVPCEPVQAQEDFWTENRLMVFDTIKSLQEAADGARIRPTDIERALDGTMKKNRVYESLTALVTAGHVERDETNGPKRPLYGIRGNGPVGPVGPVRSVLGPGGPNIFGPVRSGVSIDTGRTDQVSDLQVNGHKHLSLADVEVRDNESVSAYAKRLEMLGFTDSDVATMYYNPLRRRELVERRNRNSVSAS